ncbi:NfeD family protein [Leptolyngbya sp. FACHB-261]|uniref:NfeD family protein n=1 Tax=Leptolyngbya sp. FACHB-261 TaxID=2692806 RepID=UPI001688D8D1|nr:NfeD family protein [Leptolyngbya sp. FACHB-261]
MSASIGWEVKNNLFSFLKSLLGKDQGWKDSLRSNFSELFRHCLDIERHAIVEEKIQPGQKGRVYFSGTWWSAVCEREVTLLPGDHVRVIGICNITLIVEPLGQLLA